MICIELRLDSINMNIFAMGINVKAINPNGFQNPSLGRKDYTDWKNHHFLQYLNTGVTRKNLLRLHFCLCRFQL